MSEQRWGYSDSVLVAGLIYEYGVVMDAPCDDCGQMSMCSFHSVLSALMRRTRLTQPAIDAAVRGAVKAIEVGK